VALPLLALALVACDNQPLQITDRLSTSEAAAVAGGLLGLTLDAGTSAREDNQPAGAPARSPISFGTEVSVTAACPVGGTAAFTVGLDGAVDPPADTGHVTLDITEAPAACGVQDADSGHTITLDGAPDLAAHYVLELEAGGPYQLSGTFLGAVDWSTGDRIGTCSLDMTFDASGDRVANTGSASLTGTVCGVSVSTTVER